MRALRLRSVVDLRLELGRERQVALEHHAVRPELREQRELFDQASGLWKALAEAGVQPCGLGARDTLRLEAGMNLYGQDMDETVSPLDAGLAWTVDLVSPRDFVGKAALVARPQQYQFLGLVLADRGVLRAHQQVLTSKGSGEITSGSFSPTMQQSIALARLPLTVAIGDEVEVSIRDKFRGAKVVKPCFVRNGAVLV